MNSKIQKSELKTRGINFFNAQVEMKLFAVDVKIFETTVESRVVWFFLGGALRFDAEE